MDSLDAQCLLIHALEREIDPPDLWRHAASGELSCAYADGERTFTWGPEQVAEMARRWRDSDASESSAAASFIDVHTRLKEMLIEAGLGAADVMIHDFARGELRAVWEDEKLVVIVEKIGVSRVIRSLDADGEHPRPS